MKSSNTVVRVLSVAIILTALLSPGEAAGVMRLDEPCPEQYVLPGIRVETDECPSLSGEELNNWLTVQCNIENPSPSLCIAVSGGCTVYAETDTLTRISHQT